MTNNGRDNLAEGRQGLGEPRANQGNGMTSQTGKSRDTVSVVELAICPHTNF